MKNIYLLFSCDQWKSKDSMRLVVATTLPDRLTKVISDQIRNDTMEFDRGDELSMTGMLREIKKYNPETQLSDLNNFLVYGYVDCVRDGEVQ